MLSYGVHKKAIHISEMNGKPITVFPRKIKLGGGGAKEQLNSKVKGQLKFNGT